MEIIQKLNEKHDQTMNLYEYESYLQFLQCSDLLIQHIAPK